MDTVRPLIFGLGEVLWDVFPDGQQLGGAPANFAYFAHALGAEAFVVSRVGEDGLGDETLRHLEAIGLRTEGITRDPEHETGRASVEVDGAGVPRFVIHEPAAWDFIPGSEHLPLKDAAGVCFGTLGRRYAVSRESIRQMLDWTSPTALRVFDLNLRPPFYNEDVITEGLEMANVLKLNESELEVLSGMYALNGEEMIRLRKLAMRFQLSLVALTKGPEGSVLLQGDQESRHDAVPTQVKDTVGAGDAFTAAVVMGLLQGAKLETLHARAARLASYVCSQSGATPRVPPEFVTA